MERIRARLAGAEEGWLFAQIAGQVADRRKERCLSQADLAALVGTTQSAIARLESGGRPPSPARLGAMRGSVAALVGVLSLLAAGCGGGGEEPLSKADFQSQANAICAKYEKQLKALGTPSSIDEIPDLVQQALVILNKEIDEIAALNPPDELQSDFDKMIAASNKTKAAANDLSAAAKSGDQAAVQKALEDGNAASDEADQLATGLGLSGCNANG